VNLGPHAAFILAAYGTGLVIVAVLVAWVMADYRIQRRLLSDLDKSGVVRRSERTAREASAPVQST
jgi:heme exporter protein D